MKIYWWRPEPDYPRSADAAISLRGPRIRNFGDELTHLIMKKMGHTYEWASPCASELVITGSILEHLPDHHWAGTVCGAGKLYEDSRIHLSDARVIALRGKLTLAGCRGVKGTPVLGDPGLLVPRWIRQPVAKYDLGVLPHWNDRHLRHRFSYGHFIDPLWPPEKVIEEIASCRRLVTSSLHGMIVADAYGIPRQIEQDERAHEHGGDFKFRDYASVYDEHPHFGHMWTPPRERVERIQNDLYQALQIATGIDLGEPDRLHPQVSLLVPFRDDGEHRGRVWRWLRKYWRERFPTAEIIQGWDDGTPFSKAAAVNRAASIARGRIFVVLDADAYLHPAVLQNCANQIDEALHNGGRAWFMPYTHLFRLNHETTLQLLQTNPERPIHMPPPDDWCEPKIGESGHEPPGGTSHGHQYGAMAQVVPREAFELVGGFDPQFSGWGGEDWSFLKSLDTLYCQHEVKEADVMHFWHARVGRDWWDRQWVGQSWATANSRLAQRYSAASTEVGAMRSLCDEHPLPPFDWD